MPIGDRLVDPMAWSIRRRVRTPMSLLAGVVGDGYVLLGADGRAHDVGAAEYGYANSATQPFNKVYRVKNQPWLWGAVGGLDTAQEFGRWINSQAVSSWLDLKNRVGEKVAEINGAVRTRTRKAAGTAPIACPALGLEPPVIAVMLGGYVGGVAGLMLADEAGTCDWTDSGPLFLGFPSRTVEVVWRAVQRFRPDLVLNDPEIFAEVLAVPCETVNGLWLPVNVWKVTPTTSEKLPAASSPSP